MAIEYPDAIDTWSSKTDGVDTIMASHINLLQDSVYAIETELGTLPRGAYADVKSAIQSKLGTLGGHLTGSVTCDPGVNIDGYDISLLGSEVVDAREGADLLKENLARKGAFWTHNSVNHGKLNVNRLPDFLIAGSGLSINVLGSETSLEMDIDGYYQILETDAPVTGLMASSTCYIWAHKICTLIPTFGYTKEAPQYSYSVPTSYVSGTHWMDLAEGKMKMYNGSAWEYRKSIFIGEVKTTSSITDIDCYALRGIYDSGWFPVAANTAYMKEHMLGMIPDEIKLFGSNTYPPSNIHEVRYYHEGTSGYGGQVGSITSTNMKINDTATFNYPIRYGAGIFAPSGYYKVVARRGW
jgi:hypothetical protein